MVAFSPTTFKAFLAEEADHVVVILNLLRLSLKPVARGTIAIIAPWIT
jgi:hypothetical protein